MEIKLEMIDFTSIDERIKHLSRDEIVEMINKYYNDVPRDQIVREYNIEPKNSQIFKLLPLYKTLKIKCEYCDVQLIERFQPKSKRYDAIAHCPSCDHEQETPYCSCSNCQELQREVLLKQKKREKELIEQEEKRKKELREQEERKKREKIEAIKNSIKVEYSPNNFKKIPESNLNLEQKLYLSVLLREGLDDDLSIIKPEKSFHNKIAPTIEMKSIIYESLIEAKLIVPHYSSDFRVFLIEDFPKNYYLNAVAYWINIESFDGNYSNMIQRLLYPDSKEFESDKEFCYKMWKEISVHECIEFHLYSLKNVGFDFNPGPKTYRVFNHLLNYFSVAQIYSIIYGAVAQSTKLYQEGKMSKKHATNTVVSLCESRGEKAIADGWHLTRYIRRTDLPESLISRVFFTSILKITYLGFQEKPTLDI